MPASLEHLESTGKYLVTALGILLIGWNPFKNDFKEEGFILAYGFRGFRS